ncbi:MAG: hypothetical protein PHQ90_01155 [Sulfuricurvum sp.]|nr:hypothetical protein [Sulfuricurvum sp.]
MEVWNIRGYLYEIFIAKHLQDNGFEKCRKNETTRGCQVNSSGEIEGRGEFHQIDFSGVYTKLTPYIYPLRVLAECKYYKKPLDKKIIRQYIGVVKDITENYYVPETIKQSNTLSIFDKSSPRFTDIPMIFSANGFDTHAENLAWAQGINVISHRNIPIFDSILEIIDELAVQIKDLCQIHPTCKESECIRLIKYAINSIDIININHWMEFEHILHRQLLENHVLHMLHDIYHHCHFIPICEKIFELSKKIKEINTFIVATTDNGIIVNLVSNDSFPKELFQINADLENTQDYNPNRSYAGVYFETLDNERRDKVFYFEFNTDSQERRFYFQPNRQMLTDQFAELSEQERIDLKKDFVGRVTFLYEIDKVNRVLEIEVKFPSDTVREIKNTIERSDIQGPHRDHTN